LAAEKRTLEMMANGASLSEVLNDLCAAIDAHAPPVTSMVCLMNGEWLSPCAGPHIPATFKTAITPLRIGPARASCGDLTLSHGFSAAWSEPLISKDGEVLGTFAMYYPEPRTPQNSDFELIGAAGHIALIAIELDRSHRALKNALVEIKDSENRLRTIIDTIPALAWSARPDGSAEFFNRPWLDYAGLSAEEASDWGWTVAIHPEDRAGSWIIGGAYWLLKRPVRLKCAYAASMENIAGSSSVGVLYGTDRDESLNGTERTLILKSANAPRRRSGQMNRASA